MKYEFEGILGNVLGGYYCLRGYAKLKDLKECSTPNSAYQRDKIAEHLKDIENFYKQGKYLFYPEVILGCNFDTYEILNKIREEQNYKAKNLELKFIKTKQKISLSFNSEKTQLYRIDGNHRLEANFTDLINPIQDYEIPFCIVFLIKDIHYKDEKILFHNINFKHTPLSIEESLKTIFNDDFAVINTEFDFSPQEISDLFGEEYSLTNELLRQLKSNYIGRQIIDYFNENYRTTFLNLVSFLIKNTSKNPILKSASFLCKIINDSFTFAKELDSQRLSEGLFISIVHYKVLDELFENNCKLNLFINWIKNNNLNEIKEVEAYDIVKIFEKVLDSKSRQIFVSMPFGKDDCDDMFNATKEVIEKIARESKINFPEPIRIDELEKSYSYIITDEILSHIENSGYIIADLTYQKQNVYHEIGYAMGFIKGKGLNDNILLVMKEPEKGKENEQKYDVGFNLRGYSQLRFKNLTQFKKEIEKRIKLHFGIK